MPAPNIDLVPQEELTEQTKKKAGKAGLIFVIVLLLLTGIISVALFLYVRNLDSKIASTKASVEEKKKVINSKAPIEILARNLDSKYNILSELLTSRLYFTLLFDELAYRLPNTVGVTSLDVSTPDAVNLTGVATDYISLAKFLNALADPSLASVSAIPSGKNLFTEVAINSVTLDPVNLSAKFNLNISIDKELLKKE